MRPNGTESLRAIQGAVSGLLGPELQSQFAQEASAAVQMLAESLASEWDTAAEDLVGDNGELRDVLTLAQASLRPLADGNVTAGALVNEIDGVLGQAGGGSLALSSLTAENNRLRGTLETLLEWLEDERGSASDEQLVNIRTAAYRHLRRISVRGWTYFDVSAFRERIAKARAEVASDGAEGSR